MKMNIVSHTGSGPGSRQMAYTWQHAMFYPNTYLNFNANGEYTKHYYNGNERIVSRLGENTIDITLNNTNSVQSCNDKEFSFTIASLHIKHWLRLHWC